MAKISQANDAGTYYVTNPKTELSSQKNKVVTSYIGNINDNNGTSNLTNELTKKTYNVIKNPSYKSNLPSDTGSEEENAQNVSNVLADYWKQQNSQARTNALNSLAKRLNLNIANYENELNNVDQNYQSLINQNEVDRYKSQRALRETQANRGTLDSGLGRQEALNQYTNYANQNIGIQTQREADKQTIRNAIASLKADYESDKAEIENQYNNALLQLMANQ